MSDNINVEVKKKNPSIPPKNLRELTKQVSEIEGTIDGINESVEEAEQDVNEIKRAIDNSDDFVIRDNKFKRKNKAYNPAQYSGLGELYLEKNNTFLGREFDEFVVNVDVSDPTAIAETFDGLVYDRHRKEFLVYELVDGERVYYAEWIKFDKWESTDDYIPEAGYDFICKADNKAYRWTEETTPDLIETEAHYGNVLKQEMVNLSNTIYHIQYDYDLIGKDITIPEGCVLQFEGGSLSNGTITGNNTSIEAGLTKIFKIDVNVNGNWNITEAYPEWFGAIGDGVANDVDAINKTIMCFLTTRGRGNYYINSSININNRTFTTDGSIKSASGVDAIVLTGGHSNISIGGSLYCEDSGAIDTQRTESGISLIGGGLISHNNVFINIIKNYKRAINIAPIIPTGKNYGGVQYNVIQWQLIENCYDGIALDLSNDVAGKTWINENRFIGGRIMGVNGINSYRVSGDTNSSIFNGNTFHNIGFEGIETPIILNSLYNSKFINLRMSESITGIYYIKLYNSCSHLKFDIHSYVPSNKIYVEDNVKDVEINDNTYNSIVMNGHISCETRKQKYGATTKSYDTNSEGFDPMTGSLVVGLTKLLDLDQIGNVYQLVNVIVGNGVGLYIYVTNEDFYPDINLRLCFTCIGNGYFVISYRSGQTIIGGSGRTNIEVFWNEAEHKIGAISTYENNAGNTRPTSNLIKGEIFFDTTLNKPIWYNGTTWVDATGATV